MVRQAVNYQTKEDLMTELEQQLTAVLDKRKFKRYLTLGNLLTVWQRVMSKRKNGG